ncbi:unnamed protein product, partial [Meganyctiphanes norvegica]
MVVAAQLLLINHFIMTLTKNTVDMHDFDSQNSVSSESDCPYGCTQCSPINGCLACKPPYYLLLLREGPMQTAHCTKACPKGFYRINRKKNGFCSKCTMRGCLECLTGHNCTLCEDNFMHHQGRCYSHNDTDEMIRKQFLDRQERVLNNGTISTTPTASVSVSITSDLFSSTKSISELSTPYTTTMGSINGSSITSTHSTPVTQVVDTVTLFNKAFIEKGSIMTTTEHSTSASNSTRKSCRKRLKSKGKGKVKDELKENVDITHKESIKSSKNNINKEKKSKKRRQRLRNCGGRKRRRKQKKKKGHSSTVNDKSTKTSNSSFNISNNNTNWNNGLPDEEDASKYLASNSILISKHRNDWKSYRIRHYPRHKRLKRLLQKRHLLEEAQKVLQKQRAEKDNPNQSAYAASIAIKIRELRQTTMQERAKRKKHKLLCLYRQKHHRLLRKKMDDSTYYGPGSIFDGLM